MVELGPLALGFLMSDCMINEMPGSQNCMISRAILNQIKSLTNKKCENKKNPLIDIKKIYETKWPQFLKNWPYVPKSWPDLPLILAPEKLA